MLPQYPTPFPPPKKHFTPTTREEKKNDWGNLKKIMHMHFIIWHISPPKITENTVSLILELVCIQGYHPNKNKSLPSRLL